MKVLVAAASRHGSTREIGEVIAQELRSQGVDALYRNIQDIGNLAEFNGVVLGSAVYVGNWLKDAQEFVEENESTLAAMPVWLFSSGPIGADDPKPAGDPNRIHQLMETINAKGHRVFTGKLDKGQLGLGEKLIVNLMRAPQGDFRDWDAIRVWADEIARTCAESENA